jgi:hypothetical protein
LSSGTSLTRHVIARYAGWASTEDDKGRTYYFHEPSGRTSWDWPPPLDDAAAVAAEATSI